MKTTETLGRVSCLKQKVQAIPDSAGASEIWGFLGWNEMLDQAVAVSAQQGLDLAPVFALAPDFRDVVSIVVSGAYGFPYTPASFDWDDILTGKVHDFQGRNPKERLLSVLECTADGQYDA